MRFHVFARLLATITLLAIAGCGGGGAGGGSNPPAPTPPVVSAPTTSGNVTAIAYPESYYQQWKCSGPCGPAVTPYPFGPLAVNPAGTTFYFVDWNYLTIELTGGSWSAFVQRSYTLGSQTIAGFAFSSFDAYGNLYAVGASPTTSYLIAHADAASGQVFTPIADDVHDIETSTLSGRVLLASGVNGIQVVDNAAAKGSVRAASLPNYNCAFRVVEGANHDIDVSPCGYYNHIYRFSSTLRLLASAYVKDAQHINQIAPDPDGGVWFADDKVNRYGKMSATGAVAEYSPPPGYLVSAVATSSDGSIWFSLSNNGAGYIAKSDEKGNLTMHPLPASLVQAEYLRGSYNAPGILPDHLYFLDKFGSVGVIAIQ